MHKQPLQENITNAYHSMYGDYYIYDRKGHFSSSIGRIWLISRDGITRNPVSHIKDSVLQYYSLLISSPQEDHVGGLECG